MEPLPLVSCVIPSYKRSDSLKRAISSVLAQTYKNIEVLVVDDNTSGDEYSNALRKIIGEYKDDPRVQLVLQEKHINGAEARNEGVRHSSGTLIAFLDDDDEWLPSKIEKQVQILNTNLDIDGVSCLYNEFANGELFHSCPPYNGDGLHQKIFQREVAVFTSTILLRKNALLEAGLFDNSLRRHQDLQLLLDFTKQHQIFVLNEYLVNLHSDSAINRPSYEDLVKIKKDFFSVVDTHLAMYSKHEQRTILSAHKFELAFSALKEGKYLNVMKHILSVGLNIDAIKLLRKRMQDRRYVIK